MDGDKLIPTSIIFFSFIGGFSYALKLCKDAYNNILSWQEERRKRKLEMLTKSQENINKSIEIIDTIKTQLTSLADSARVISNNHNNQVNNN